MNIYVQQFVSATMSTKIFFFAMVLLVIPACESHDHEAHEEQKLNQTDEHYTCPMHPSVKSDKPGSCPICGMTLVKETRQPVNPDSSNDNSGIFLTERQEYLAAISTDTVQYKRKSTTRSVTGTVVTDETLVRTFTSRLNGRIEKLFVRNPGDAVTVGMPLYQIYSEQLLADKTDFINAKREVDRNSKNYSTFRSLMEASRHRLELWGLSQQQIEGLTQSSEMAPYINVNSTIDGTITNLSVREGEYVNEGTIILKAVDLSTVWVEAQVYVTEVEILRKSTRVEVRFEDDFTMPLTGRFVFDNPTLSANTAVTLVYIAIQNPDHRLKPGMMAYVDLNQREHSGLVVPRTAILEGDMNSAWVRTTTNRYEPRMVKTGIRNRFEIEIVDGLEEGDIVVSSGAYLLTSQQTLLRGKDALHKH